MRTSLVAVLVISVAVAGCTAVDISSPAKDTDSSQFLPAGTVLTYTDERRGDFNATIKAHNDTELTFNLHRSDGAVVNKRTLEMERGSLGGGELFFPLSSIVESHDTVESHDISTLIETGERIELADGATIERLNQYERQGVPITELSFSDIESGQTMRINVTTESPYLLLGIQSVDGIPPLQLQAVRIPEER